MTQQHRVDWQPYRGEKHSPENPVICNLNNTEDMALIIFDTPLCDQSYHKGEGIWSRERGPRAAGEGPEGS